MILRDWVGALLYIAFVAGFTLVAVGALTAMAYFV